MKTVPATFKDVDEVGVFDRPIFGRKAFIYHGLVNVIGKYRVPAARVKRDTVERAATAM
jgi:hypothetical protein